MLEIIVIMATAGAGLAGFLASRDFTRKKLRFVDAAQGPAAPLVAGGVAALVTLPFWILPFIGVGTAVAVGAGVALGVKSAQNQRKLLP